MCGLNFQVGYQDRLRVNSEADEAPAYNEITKVSLLTTILFKKQF